MVIRAEIGNWANEGVLLSSLRSGVSHGGGSGGGLLSDIVDAVVLVLVLVGLATEVHHGGLVPFAGKAVLLEVPLFLAVPAGSVGVSHGGEGAGLVAAVATVVVSVPGVANDSKLGSWSSDRLSQIISLALSSSSSCLMALMRLSLLWSFWMVSRLRATLTLSVNVSLAASSTLSWMPSFRPARKVGALWIWRRQRCLQLWCRQQQLRERHKRQPWQQAFCL